MFQLFPHKRNLTKRRCRTKAPQVNFPNPLASVTCHLCRRYKERVVDQEEEVPKTRTPSSSMWSTSPGWSPAPSTSPCSPPPCPRPRPPWSLQDRHLPKRTPPPSPQESPGIRLDESSARSSSASSGSSSHGTGHRVGTSGPRWHRQPGCRFFRSHSFTRIPSKRKKLWGLWPKVLPSIHSISQQVFTSESKVGKGWNDLRPLFLRLVLEGHRCLKEIDLISTQGQKWPYTAHRAVVRSVSSY